MELSIDLETYSSLDIRSVGTYRYAENSEILLFAYAFDDEPVQVVDFTQGEKLPDQVFRALFDESIAKTAYNAAFEINVINHWLSGIDPPDLVLTLDPKQWYCTMVLGLSLGLPAGLDALGRALHLSEDKQKLSIGKRLIQYFCKPCRPTKANGERVRNLPEHDPEKWELFKVYCLRDVESERALRRKLQRFQPSEKEHRLWVLDQKINASGVQVDLDLVYAAIDIDQVIKESALDEMQELTGLDNPNSNPQLKAWVEQAEGITLGAFDKQCRSDLLANPDISENTRHVMELKNLISKTSVKKYEAMANMACRDGRVKGMLQFYGASRTGRWAGRGVQLQNLPQNHIDDLTYARNMVKARDLDSLQMFYDSPSDVLSQLIRTAFISGEGKRFIVADFSAIEARVIAWIAGEKWRQQAFAEGKDIYCESASQMFHVPVVKHGVNGELRAKGKIAELACGYGGGVNALRAFGADRMGMTEQEMTDTITRWRKTSPHVCQLWRELEDCAKNAILYRSRVKREDGPVPFSFSYEKGVLFLELPSGRRIAYARPRVEQEDAFGRETITYEGTSLGGWNRVYTWGGKLTENLVQATARDCLASAMMRLDAAGYRIVMHVHDEVILEMPYGKGSLEEAVRLMCQPMPWTNGLILNADGYETEFYRKD